MQAETTPALSCEDDVFYAIGELGELEEGIWEASPGETDWVKAALAAPDLYQRWLQTWRDIRQYDAAGPRAGRSWFPKTSCGFRFWPFHSRPEDFIIEDVAHSLANIIRFNGHLEKPLTVAQHSVYVADHLPPEFAFLGLMHDAPESFCHDIISPLKPLFQPMYGALESNVWQAMVERFGIVESEEAWKAVKEADTRAVATEARDLFVFTSLCFHKPVRPYPDRIGEVWTHDEAEQRFLQRFLQLAPPLSEVRL